MNSNFPNPNSKTDWQTGLTQTVAFLRQFFLARGFREYIIPSLSASVTQETPISPFKTIWRQLDQTTALYLATSPEKILKNFLAEQLRNTSLESKIGVFGFSWSYRNLESTGPLHQPEFLMLEWYRTQSQATEIKQDVETLRQELQTQNQNVVTTFLPSKSPSAATLPDISPGFSLADWWEKTFNCSIKDVLAIEELKSLAQKNGAKIKQADWEALFNQLVLNQIWPQLPPTGSFFLHDYPATISPLAAQKENQPWLADRWEWFVNGIELANGCTEPSLDEISRLAASQSDAQFVADSSILAQAKTAGAGLGVERLSMLLQGLTTLPNRF